MQALRQGAVILMGVWGDAGFVLRDGGGGAAAVLRDGGTYDVASHTMSYWILQCNIAWDIFFDIEFDIVYDVT